MSKHNAVKALDEFMQWLIDEPHKRYDDDAKCALWDAADMLSEFRKKYDV